VWNFEDWICPGIFHPQKSSHQVRRVLRMKYAVARDPRLVLPPSSWHVDFQTLCKFLFRLGESLKKNSVNSKLYVEDPKKWGYKKPRLKISTSKMHCYTSIPRYHWYTHEWFCH
jgi:hypothetical protein